MLAEDILPEAGKKRNSGLPGADHSAGNAIIILNHIFKNH
jgi:hypothetical protein